MAHFHRTFFDRDKLSRTGYITIQPKNLGGRLGFRFIFPELQYAFRGTYSFSTNQYNEVHNVAIPQLMAIVDERIKWAKARLDKGEWANQLSAEEAWKRYVAFPAIVKELRQEAYYGILNAVCYRMSCSPWRWYKRDVYRACNAVNAINKLAR